MDIYNYCGDVEGKNPISIVFYVIMFFFINRGFRAVLCHRISAYFYSKNKNIYNLFKPLEIIFNNIEISTHVDIGPGFLLPHPQCIVIGGGRIGSNVAIFQGVTIGLKSLFMNIL